MAEPKWLAWVKRIQLIAQAGLTYADDYYDIERYEQLVELASEMAAEYTDVPAEKINHLYRQERGYQTPKVDVRGAVFNEQGAILLVKESRVGKWTLPGGWADAGDTPSSAVEREILEESGYEAKAIKLIAVVDRDNQQYPTFDFATYKMFFLCRLDGGTARTSYETDAVGFFSLEDLPILDIGRTSTAHLMLCFQHYALPDLPTVFD